MSGFFRRRVAGWAAMALIAAALGHQALAADNAAKAIVRFSLNPVTLGNLPIFLAVDKGYFAAQNIDLRLTKYGGSSVTQMPLAARGDLDITMMVAGPALFNQQREGFDLKIIASMQQTRSGWSDGEWIVVRKDLWDSGAIRRLADFKGRRVDGGPDGSPVSLVMNLALAKAGLTRADMIYSKKLASPADWIAVFRNKAVDVIAVPEPVASLVESQGLGHKFMSDQDVAPWFQVSYLIASEKYIQDHRATVTAFIEAYLKAAQDITASGQKWTPALLHEVTKWSQLKEADIAGIPGPSYYGQLGAINRVSLTRQQDYLAAIAQVKTKLDIDSLIDDGPLLAARHEMAIQ
jgi:NitT/TauT family transport system substrate-binding protein